MEGELRLRAPGGRLAAAKDGVRSFSDDEMRSAGSSCRARAVHQALGWTTRRVFSWVAATVTAWRQTSASRR